MEARGTPVLQPARTNDPIMLPPVSAPESTRTGLTTVCTVAWRVGCGRIYQTRGSPDNLRWFWSMTVNGPMTRSDRVATLGRQAKSVPTKSRFSLQEFVRSHDLIRKVCNFSGSCFGRSFRRTGMHGRRGAKLEETE